MSNTSPLANQHAFTAIELMVSIAIAALVVAAGVPAFHQFSLNQRIKAAVLELQNDLVFARGEAIHRNRHVVACPGSPQSGCLNVGNWSTGWIVFEDRNNDQSWQADEAVIRQGHGTDLVHIRSSASRTSVRFLSDGSTPGSNSSILFCGPDPRLLRKLIISNLGRIRREAYPALDPALCAA